MQTTSVIIILRTYFLYLTAVAVFLMNSVDACSRRELIVFTSGTLEYRSEGKLQWMSGSLDDHDFDVYCEVLFTASPEENSIRLEVNKSNLKPRLSNNKCFDKVVVFDGSSRSDAVLGEFCAHETPIFESSGNSLLLVFETDAFPDKDVRGFTVTYSSMSKRSERSEHSQNSFGAGAIGVAVIISAILYSALLVVIYRKCKYARRQVRQNLTVSGYTPGNSRVPLTAMIDQVNLGHHNHEQNQLFRNSTNGVVPDFITAADMPSRPGSAHSSCQRSRRVRHPAGDIQRLQFQQPAIHYPCYGNSLDNNNSLCYGPQIDEPCDPVGTKASQHFLPLFPPDPSGVYYAGSIDEHGILHLPGNQSHLSRSAAPSVASAGRIYAHHVDSDRRSRESSHSCQSLHHSGRNSPRESSHGSSSGRGSPFRNRMHNTVVIYNGSPRLMTNVDTEGQTYTFYGMIDGVAADNPASGSGGRDISDGGERSVEPQAAAGILHPDDSHLYEPPPSYEDAATGKYSPHLSKQ